ncbi:hypothetical protein BKA93DRAFT_751645 [Sparassis latifolia]
MAPGATLAAARFLQSIGSRQDKIMKIAAVEHKELHKMSTSENADVSVWRGYRGGEGFAFDDAARTMRVLGWSKNISGVAGRKNDNPSFLPLESRAHSANDNVASTTAGRAVFDPLLAEVEANNIRHARLTEYFEISFFSIIIICAGRKHCYLRTWEIAVRARNAVPCSGQIKCSAGNMTWREISDKKLVAEEDPVWISAVS